MFWFLAQLSIYRSGIVKLRFRAVRISGVVDSSLVAKVAFRMISWFSCLRQGPDD